MTSRRMFIVFFICFGIGAAAIFMNQYPIWIATGLVVLYSIFLHIIQSKFYIALPAATKNSSYFLGFLFTLLCLMNIFIGMPGDQTNMALTFSVFLIPQIGTALSTTIVGLIGRQFILSFDPIDEQTGQLFKLAADELKENAASYRIAQQKLLDLINDFVKTRSELMEQEEDASKQHITLLSESMSTMAKLGQEYPQKIKQILESFNEIQTKCEGFVNEGIPDIHSTFVEKTSEHIEKIYTNVSQSVEGSFDKIKDQIETFENSVTTFSKSFKECSIIMDDGFRKGLQRINGQFSNFSTVMETLQGYCNNLETQINSFDELYAARLRSFKDELKELDNVIDTFIKITKKRLE